ncbi:Yip1 family protein [Falsirhodobacter deserti]|uniref:Yip1 family protein n=1 Tax=Falsirhodobacter deserti TaxID=1365611 RepID=UPI0013E388F5|nr:Yip1 family protein [Falsirhodobacter deserti]
MRTVLDLSLQRGERISLFLLAAILPTLLIFVAFSLSPASEEVAGFPISPMPLLVAQAGALLMMSAVTFWIGRWRGGTGSFANSIITLSWLQIVMVAAQVAFLVLELALPFVAAIVGILALMLMLWLVVNFVAELHGFQSLGLVFVGVIGTLFVLSFVLAFLSSILLGI